jgi:hypothetical protein
LMYLLTSWLFACRDFVPLSGRIIMDIFKLLLLLLLTLHFCVYPTNKFKLRKANSNIVSVQLCFAAMLFTLTAISLNNNLKIIFVIHIL